MEKFIEIVTAIRNLKADFNIPPKTEVDITISTDEKYAGLFSKNMKPSMTQSLPKSNPFPSYPRKDAQPTPILPLQGHQPWRYLSLPGRYRPDGTKTKTREREREKMQKELVKI